VIRCSAYCSACSASSLRKSVMAMAHRPMRPWMRGRGGAAAAVAWRGAEWGSSWLNNRLTDGDRRSAWVVHASSLDR
jgi:hypothetical protein